jgi:hypothetical protein
MAVLDVVGAIDVGLTGVILLFIGIVIAVNTFVEN